MLVVRGWVGRRNGGYCLMGIEFPFYKAKRVLEMGTSLVVQWVRLHTPNAGGPGSIPGQGTRSLMHAATKSSHASTKIPHAAAKSACCNKEPARCN